MAVRRIAPKSQDRPVLASAGLYGPGAEFEAEVVVQDYVGEVTEAKQMPAFDREGADWPYCMFVFRVKHNGQLYTLRSYQSLAEESGSNAIPWLKALGVSVSDDGEYDDREVIGKKCILDVKAPRTGKDGTRYTGDIKRVIGV